VVPSARKDAGHRETIRIVSRKGRRDERRCEVARIFITGSSDGLGLMAARLLVDQGHEVVLHGRNEGRSREALAAAAGARGVVSGDLSTIAGARTLADDVNKLGRFDAIIHNAGVGYRERRVEMEPGVPSVFAVNVLAPYILTALIKKPKRLVYLSSGMHRGVRPKMDDLLWTTRSWSAKPDSGRPQDAGGVAGRVRPHLRHSSRLTARPDGTQPGQLVLTFRPYEEPTVRISLPPPEGRLSERVPLGHPATGRTATKI